jgi:hypothetical protein
MAQAAIKHNLLPRTISFKGALQTLEALQPVIALRAAHNSQWRLNLYQRLLDAVAVHRVADRPDRFEPRLRKRRHKKYFPLLKPTSYRKLSAIREIHRSTIAHLLGIFSRVHDARPAVTPIIGGVLC